jgi:hypothetical protein
MIGPPRSQSHPRGVRPLLLVGLAAIAAIVGPGTPVRAAEVPSAATQPVEPARNAVYFELGGTCLVLSVSYERRLADAWPLRFCLGVIPPGTLNPGVLTPAVTMGRLVGAGAHHLELAAGLTGWYESSSLGVLASGVIGYRYQPRGGGAVFRVGFTPLVTLRRPHGETLRAIVPLFGISVGTSW